MTRIVVVGAGLLGSSVAYHLAQAGLGADVTVVERGRPGSGTSGTSFAWANAQDKSPADYFELNREGVLAYPGLAETLRGTWYHPGGDVTVGRGEAAAAAVTARIERHAALGYPVRSLDRDAIATLEPALALGDGQVAGAHFDAEAWIDAPVLVGRFLRAASAGGVTVRVDAPIVGFDTVGDRIIGVRTAGGSVLPADIVVAAAGPRTSDLVATVGIALPMDPTPGLLAYTAPVATGVDHVVHGGDVGLRPDGGGRLLLSSRVVDAALDPTDLDLGPDSAPVRDLVARAVALVPALDGVRIEAVRIGRRSVATDGEPVAGFAESPENLYLLVSHSGVTLANVLGRLAAGEIAGPAEARFARFRPARFASVA